MQTCEECIHFAVCDSGRHIGEYIEDDGIYSDGVEKECPFFIASVEDARKEVFDNLIYKLECLLCHATGSKLSKHTYDLKTMETVVTDYVNESYDEGYKDGRAEVELLEAEKDALIKNYAMCMKDYARVIFEEIDDAMIDHARGETTDHWLFVRIEELKNKYT